MTDRIVLEMRGIRKTFPGVVALRGVDLTLRAGEVHVLLGENGAGKSTLMKVLSGACMMDGGELHVGGRRREINGPRDAIALGVRTIYQELNLVPSLSVAENVLLGAAPTYGGGIIARRRLHARAQDVLSELGVTLPVEARVARLSLAERQMVEIARAVRDLSEAGEGRVLVMDEPTSALTPREVERLFALMARLTARGVAIVYITHRLDEVYRVGHRVTVLRDGSRVTTKLLSEVTLADLVRLMAGDDVGEHFPRVRQPPGEEILRLEQVTRPPAIHGIDLSLRAGEVVGLAGLLGAGRSELARVIAGADRATGGRFVVNGRPAVIKSPVDAVRCGVGLLPEDRKGDGLVGGLTVTRNIALPHARRLARFGFLSPGAEERFAAPWIRDLRIKAAPSQPVRLLSGGNQQKVVLARWMAGAARVFIFDEPTRGVDVGARVEIYRLMNRLTAAGAGILMISSDLPELLGMSDRVVVMQDGRIRHEMSASEATAERVLTAAFGLR